MNTHMGIKFFHFHSDPSMMNILDVAKALSQNCRFNGHTPFHYSVAQHSLLVDDLFCKMFPDQQNNLRRRRTCLLHDCGETWVPDVHSAVKHKLPDYLALLREIEDKAAEAFDLEWPEHPQVKLVDGILVSTELVKLMKTTPHILEPRLDIEIRPMKPEKVELEFMKRWEQLRP